MMKRESFRKRTLNYALRRFVLNGILRGNPIWLFFGTTASLLWFKSLLVGKNRKHRIFSHKLEVGEEVKLRHLSLANEE